jgi:hypothetical protein
MPEEVLCDIDHAEGQKHLSEVCTHPLLVGSAPILFAHRRSLALDSSAKSQLLEWTICTV